MSDSNKNLHEIRFLPPCGREDPANGFAAFALRWNQIIPPAPPPAPKYLPFASKAIGTGCGRKDAGRKIPGRPKGERRRAAAGVPLAEGDRNGNTDSVSERTGDEKSSGFSVDM